MQTQVFKGIGRKIVDTFHGKFFYYHDTPVVVIRDETICLNTGGYMTATTKRAMNQVSQEYNLGFNVYQKKKVWYCDYRNKTIQFNENTMVLDK